MDYGKAIRSCLGMAVFFAVMYFLAHGPWYYWIASGANLLGAATIKLIQVRRAKAGMDPPEETKRRSK